MNEADIRAAAARIVAPGSVATDDARVVAAAWLAEHPAGDGSCVEIEDTPGSCAPDAEWSDGASLRGAQPSRER